MQQLPSLGSGPTRLDHEFFDNEVRPHLGAVLLRSRVLKPEQLDAALAEQREQGKRLGEILIERQWIFPDDLARALATQAGLDYVDIQNSSIDRAAASTLEPAIGLRRCAIPVRFLADRSLLVAIADPTSPGLAEIQDALLGPVVFAVAEAADIRAAWNALLNGGRR
jgi:type IV pilus assembly protein PilB